MVLWLLLASGSKAVVDHVLSHVSSSLTIHNLYNEVDEISSIVPSFEKGINAIFSSSKLYNTWFNLIPIKP